MPYSKLDADKIIATAERLERRIAERFAQSGLCSVARELTATGRGISAEAATIEKNDWFWRALSLAGIAAGAIVLFLAFRFLRFDRIETGTFDILQGIDALFNTAVLTGAGLVALMGLEKRQKRRAVLEGLHKLRSLIHVIDMHQLTKDPAALSRDFIMTESSPLRSMTAAELKRYLDYCSELLSLTGKFAALYAQTLPDMEVVNAVNDVEALGTNLSRKIWQKIMLIGDPSRQGEGKTQPAATGMAGA
ncbi:MAG: hypothetical protein H6889_01050 [Brucellaceae bacterium]|nr:hypothetical protein [Notoacmeibacter sp.]MCC0025565.1 hypothetical protein [Brucellaceae bacterium]